MDPIDVVQRWFEAHARGDLEAARRLVADDVDIDVPRARLRGFEAFMTWYQERRVSEGPSFSYEVEELLGGQRHAAAVLTLSVGSRRWRQVALYELEGGLIRGIWARESEPSP